MDVRMPQHNGRTDIVVVGAGVIGLTTAVCLAESGLAVRVRAALPPPRTTSAVAGAIIGGPVLASPAEAAKRFPPVELTSRWHRTSLDEFEALSKQPGTGVRVARGRLVNRHGVGELTWVRQLPGYEPCNPAEHAGFPVAFWASLPIVDMPVYLEYLAGRCADAGGTVDIAPVASLAELAREAPLIVHCAGVGARGLAGDDAVVAVRGQQVVVENPDLREFFFEQSPTATSTSFIPHGSRLLLGGTAERGEWGLEPDPAQTLQIVRRCSEVEPRIAGATVRGAKVGLRASRPTPRLEEESIGGARVIHNYGHGGVAVGLSWGCAREVRALVLKSQT
jgi:D-amino-acid oxidase